VYKLLLCVRYLQTRYLALICIVSVMLGVATLIVVNAVMSGFSTKLKDRLHGVLSDIIVHSDRTDGIEVLDDNPDPHKRRPLTPEQTVAKIMASPAGDMIEAISPTIDTFAILQFRYRGTVIAKPVQVIGIDPASRARVGGFKEFLVRQRDLPGAPTFDLTPEARQRHTDNVKQYTLREGANVPAPKLGPLVKDPNAIPEPDENAMTGGIEKPQLHGIILGFALAHYRFDQDGVTVEEAMLKPGDNVRITTAGGEELKPVFGDFLVTDYLKTEMSEYDRNFVYVPLDQLQRIRGMLGRATSFQIKLKHYDRDKVAVSRELAKIFDSPDVHIATWEQHQGPLLAAIDVERAILNLLLFMIVGVAGFSILAIFSMIVSEKFRDIGIMKSLGASNWGVMSIFLGYGLLLGTVGCVAGTGLGLWITANINEIEMFLSKQTGVAVFPRDVYYFKEIPTNVEPLRVAAVNAGAVLIAAAFSLLPAWRAARLHPVRALRFE